MLSSDVGFFFRLRQPTPCRAAWYLFSSIEVCFFVATGTYLTNEAKGADDAPDADTAIINAEGNHAHAEEKKEYFI